MSARRPAASRSTASPAAPPRAHPTATPAPDAGLADPFARLPTAWACATLVLLTLLAYLPTLGAGLIWDDAGHVTRADLRGLDGLLRIWFEPGATQQYYPLLHSAFWLESQLWGDSAAGYHLINVLQHAASAVLFGLLLLRLRAPGAWLAALLFALHPVAVESVAWVSEQKNTLSLLFYLLAALAWLRWEEHRSPRRYLLATGLFLCALATKTVTATLPAALLVLAWWRRGRLSWRTDVLPLLPWFALSALAGLVTAWFEHSQIGAQGADFALGPLERVMLAGRIVWFYAAKLLLPLDLCFIYPRWTIAAGDPSAWLYPLAALATLGALAWLAWRRGIRGPLAAALLFGGTLFPALGFIDVYPFVFSYVADHFQYHACLAVLALAAVGLLHLAAALRRRGAPAFVSPFLLAGLLAAALGPLTWARTGIYRDVFTLYADTLARHPACWMAHNNLASALVEAGRADEAIAHFEQALALRPRFAEAANNLGDALTRLGRPTEALTHLARANEWQPRYAEARNNYGVALLSLGRTAEGIAQLEQALRLRPVYPVAHFNLGLAHAREGRMAAAITQFETAVRQQPDYEAARTALEQARRELGRP